MYGLFGCVQHFAQSDLFVVLTSHYLLLSSTVSFSRRGFTFWHYSLLSSACLFFWTSALCLSLSSLLFDTWHIHSIVECNHRFLPTARIEMRAIVQKHFSLPFHTVVLLLECSDPAPRLRNTYKRFTCFISIAKMHDASSLHLFATLK